jgi:hypothetical protein
MIYMNIYWIDAHQNKHNKNIIYMKISYERLGVRLPDRTHHQIKPRRLPGHSSRKNYSTLNDKEYSYGCQAKKSK